VPFAKGIAAIATARGSGNRAVTYFLAKEERQL